MLCYSPEGQGLHSHLSVHLDRAYPEQAQHKLNDYIIQSRLNINTMQTLTRASDLQRVFNAYSKQQRAMFSFIETVFNVLQKTHQFLLSKAPQASDKGPLNP